MLNWSAIGRSTTWGRLLRLPIRFIPNNLWLSVLQGPMKGMKWISGSGNAGCWLGSYELSNQRALQRVIKPGNTVFDIGAHVGFYTLLFSALVGGNGRVFAFEPFYENISNLLRHIQKNNCRRNVTVCQTAVSDKRKLSRFTDGLSSYTGTILETIQSNPILSYYVPAVSLDELVEMEEFPIPDVIKMDVEGAESDVLWGSRSLMEKNGPAWFISLHGDKQKQKCRHILERFSYDLFSLDGEKIQLGETLRNWK